jgi:hypothetical protein
MMPTLALLITLSLAPEPSMVQADVRQLCPSGMGASLHGAPLPCQMGRRKHE